MFDCPAAFTLSPRSGALYVVNSHAPPMVAHHAQCTNATNSHQCTKSNGGPSCSNALHHVPCTDTWLFLFSQISVLTIGQNQQDALIITWQSTRWVRKMPPKTLATKCYKRTEKIVHQIWICLIFARIISILLFISYLYILYEFINTIEVYEGKNITICRK